MTASTKTSSKAKPTVTQEPVVEDAQFDLRTMLAAMGVEIPSGRRLLVGFLIQLAVGAIGGYAAGAVATYAMVGAALLTGSMFIAWAAFIIAFIIGCYAVMIVASKTAAYAVGGKLEAHAKSAKDWVTSFWTARKPAIKGAAA